MTQSLRPILVPLIVGLGLAACASPERGPAVPNNLYTQAGVPGLEDVRYFIDDDPQPFVDDAIEAYRREVAYRNGGTVKPATNPPKGVPTNANLPPARFLAISGGGDNGAFGAGLLVGWTARGDRPEFKVVTGVSTGALTAPFAFLGPDYDDALREVYTTISAEDVLRRRPFLEIIFGDSAADNDPLWQTIARYADDEMMRRIAEEHDKGRLLLIATTNLDAQRPIVWNIGKIAKSSHPDALNLFHAVLVASAAIPGAFPPVMIDVEANGEPYQEMHVDGGAISQVFLYPPSLNIEEIAEQYDVAERRKRELYLIRNARLDPEWGNIERRIFTIAGRAISSLIQSQGLGDLYRIYLAAERDDIDYNLAHIPESFEAEREEEFDTVYMNKLFDVGYAMALEGYPWEKYPPDYNPDDGE